MNDEFFVDKAHPLLFVLDRHFQPFEIHALAMGVNWALGNKQIGHKYQMMIRLCPPLSS